MYNSELDTFLIVAEMGSFSKAAKKLYISKNAVIQQMNILEEKLDLTLFNRTNHGITLTVAGKAFVEQVKKLQKMSREIEHSMAFYKNTICVGVGYLNQQDLITKIWQYFSKQYPKSKLYFQDIVDYENIPDNVDLIEGIYSDQPFSRQGFKFKKYLTSPFMIAVPKDSALAQKKSLTLQDTYGKKLMIPSYTTSKLSNRIKDELMKEAPQLQIKTFEVFNTALINNAQMNGDLILVPEKLGFLCKPYVLKKVDWQFSVDYGLFYKTNCSKLCQQFLNYTVD